MHDYERLNYTGDLSLLLCSLVAIIKIQDIFFLFIVNILYILFFYRE